MAIKEMELTSKTYEQIQVTPAGAKLTGEMQLSEKTYGFYLTAFTAAMLALNEDATLITKAESVKVVKAAGSIWVAGQPIFWIEASGNYTNVDDGSGYLVGKAQVAATSPAVIGYVNFRDYYPTQRGMQIGTSSIPYKIAADDPIFSAYILNTVGAGTVDGVKYVMTQDIAAASGYVKAMRVHLESNVKVPGSGHAIYGKIDLKTNGHAHGMVACVGAELQMPNSSAPRGSFYAMESQIGIPASGSWGSAGPLAFHKITVNASGAALARFEAAGFLFDITGVAEANDAFCDNGGSPAEADGGIRIRINGNTRYLLYADDPET